MANEFDKALLKKLTIFLLKSIRELRVEATNTHAQN